MTTTHCGPSYGHPREFGCTGTQTTFEAPQGEWDTSGPRLGLGINESPPYGSEGWGLESLRARARDCPRALGRVREPGHFSG
jgi:hypothetical protein